MSSDFSFAPPPSGTSRVELGAAISYAWNRFTANWLPWVLISLPLVVVLYFQVITSIYGGPGAGRSAVLSFLIAVVVFVVGLFYKVIVSRGALLEIDGSKPALGDFLAVPAWGPPLMTALVVSVLTNLPAWVLPTIAGWLVVYGAGGGVLGLIALLLILLTLVLTLAVVFFTFFAVNYTLDKQLPSGEALKASYTVIRANLKQMAILALANAGLIIAGVLACGLGLLVAIPIVLIASAYAYRVLALGPVATVDVPPEPPYPPMPG